MDTEDGSEEAARAKIRKTEIVPSVRKAEVVSSLPQGQSGGVRVQD